MCCSSSRFTDAEAGGFTAGSLVHRLVHWYQIHYCSVNRCIR